MAAHAGFGRMAQRTRRPVIRSILAMDIILPTYGVGCRPHDLVAADALVSTGHGGLHGRMANEALGACRGCFRVVVGTEILRVEVRLDKAGMAGRSGNSSSGNWRQWSCCCRGIARSRPFWGGSG
jgi:hypothetical protein